MNKKTKAWAVIDFDKEQPKGFLVGDGSLQLAIFFNREEAQNWKKNMLGKTGKVVSCEITLKSK